MSKDEIKKYLTEIGKKGGLKNKEKGPEYFKWVVSQRKKNPVKNKPVVEYIKGEDKEN